MRVAIALLGEEVNEHENDCIQESICTRVCVHGLHNISNSPNVPPSSSTLAIQTPPPLFNYISYETINLIYHELPGTEDEKKQTNKQKNNCFSNPALVYSKCQEV